MHISINKLAAEEKTAIRAEQVHSLYANNTTAVVGNALIALILAGMQWRVVAAPSIISWLVLMMIVLAVRTLLFVAHRRAAPGNDSIWLQHYRISVSAIGVVWGLASLLIFPAHNLPHQAFLTFALGGMTAAAITTLSIDRVSLLAFTLPALVPVIVHLFVEGTEIQTAMGVMIALYLFLTNLVSQRTYRTLCENVILRISLARREHEFSSLVESAPDSIIRYNLECRAVYVNHMLETMVDVVSGSLIGKTPMESKFNGLLGVENYQTKLQQVIYTGESQDVEIMVSSPGGDQRSHHVCFVAERGSNGEIIGALAFGRDITERKQVQQLLQYKEQMLSISQHIAHIGSWSMELATGCITWSDEMYQIFGVTQKTFRHTLEAFFDLIHPEDHAVAKMWISDCLDGKESRELDFRITLPDGTVRFICGRGELQYDEMERPLRIVGSAQDVTERKQAEWVLNQLKAMIDISLDGFWIVDLMGNLLQVNEAYTRISGYSIDELVHMNISQLEAMEEPEQVKEHIAKVVAQGFDLFETRHRHKDGHIIDIEISVAFLPEFQQFCVFCRDITKRKAMEDELKASEAKFRTIIEVSPVPMALNDEQLNITFLNPAFVQTFGYSVDDIPTLADWWSKACPDPDYRHWAEATWQTTLEKAKQEQPNFPPIEASIRCKNNSIKTVLATAGAIHNNFAGEHLVILYDITQRKQIEAKLNAIFNASVEGIITIDMFGIIVSANAAVETIFGYKPEELIGCSISKLMPSSPKEMDGGSLPSAIKGVGQIQEIEGIHKNGSVVPLDLSIAEYSIDNAHYFTYIVRDVSLRKHREQLDKEHLDQLAHVTRLGLMGEMASGIAHEVNQPLMAICSYSQVSLNLINTENPDLVQLIEILDKTRQQALRAGRIIHRMREFVKSHSKHRSTADINTLIYDAVNLCNAELKHNDIKLTFKLENNLPPVYVDHIQIEQVIINLIRNSIDALQSLSAKQQRHLSIHSQLIFNNDIQVRVKDNGSGIDEEQQQKILMPFYTTKSDGMGMGLSISRSIIEAHEGTLHFKSKPKKGTVFYFTLPAQRELCIP